MQVTGDIFEVWYYVIEHFFYWKSKDKTLYTLNMCVMVSLGLLPVLVIPLRYFVVVAMWSITALNSPFTMAVFKSLV